MKLEDIREGCRLTGISGDTPVEILHTEMYGQDAVRVTYQGLGNPAQRVVRRHEEDQVTEVASSSSAFAFNGDAHLFQLALEAQRIRLAPHFDPYIAMDSSKIDPLPHQLKAVYDIMLHRHPLRFLLADDPGAGKTVMAGLLIKELLIRRTLERCLIIAPGSLVEQWQDEMFDKFNLSFEILLPERLSSSAARNPFDGYPLMIAKLDMLARSKGLMGKLKSAPPWDLVICDEAHRMSARISGGVKDTTLRYELGKVAGRKSHHFLLMTATPHNGKEEEFQLFMGLLNEDRFGLLDEDRWDRPFGDGVNKEDTSDAVHRTTKEEMCRLDGKPLFPERMSYTVAYPLSQNESELYEYVTHYVQDEMNRVKRLGSDGKLRQINVGFALQILQRRLASSPAAIHESLIRRKNRLEENLQEEMKKRVGQTQNMNYKGPDLGKVRDEDWFYERPEEVFEEHEELFVNQATAAQTIDELKSEIALLGELEKMAKELRLSGEDTKWQQLQKILDDPKVLDSDSSTRRKIVIFTEARDTLQYLAERIRKHTGKSIGIVVIHGNIDSEARRNCIESFNYDPMIQIMLATDAAGEGVNLHHGAHLMVNYDLPWNPNRLEQRFGRIHRIGQTKTCHLWNLVAKDTREGTVYLTLLDKLDSARKALGGKVYDVLGDLFECRSLRDMMMEAIQYGDSPEVISKLDRELEDAINIEHYKEVAERYKLTNKRLDPSTARRIRSDMERTAVRSTQSQHVSTFFGEAFRRSGGKVKQSEEGYFEVLNVPQCLRDFYAKSRHGTQLPTKYERIGFDGRDNTGPSDNQIIAPGHPLLDTLIDFSYEKYSNQLLRGAVFVDDLNRFEHPRIMIVVRQVIRDGQSANIDSQNIVLQRLLYVWLDDESHTIEEASKPCILGREALDSEKEAVLKILQQNWLNTSLEKRAKEVTWREVTAGLLEEVQCRRKRELGREMEAVELRFSNEIEDFEFLANRYNNIKIRSERYQQKAENLKERLNAKREDIECQLDINAPGPEVCGVAIVIPKCVLPQSTDENAIDKHFTLSHATRKKVDEKAIRAVMSREVALGRVPKEISNSNSGYDIESTDQRTNRLLFIGVKGRNANAPTISMTKNEIMTAYNAKDAYTLAVILIDEDTTVEQVYLQNPIQVIGPPPELNEYFRHISIEKIRSAARQSY